MKYTYLFLLCAARAADLRGLMNAIGCSFPDMPARMHFLMDSDQTVHLRRLISAINVRIQINKPSIYMCTQLRLFICVDFSAFVVLDDFKQKYL